MSSYEGLASEDKFKSFMVNVKDIQDLDIIANKLPQNVQIADYTINNLLVLELKVLKSDPKSKIEDYCHKAMERPDFPAVYGTVDMWHVATNLMPDGGHLIRDIENKAFRQVESIISKANRQIASTIENMKMNIDTYGVLVIINEEAKFFKPDVLASYIHRKLVSRNSDGFRFSNINQIILIQDTHKTIVQVSKEAYVPIYKIANNHIKPTITSIKAEKRLEVLIDNYACLSEHRYVEASDFNGSMDIEEIDREVRESLNGQEVIEEHYRNERYMEKFSEDELLDFGSKVISVVTAMFLKINPLIIEPRQKMIFLKAYIELLEESRLRPFDMRKLRLDTNISLKKTSKYSKW